MAERIWMADTILRPSSMWTGLYFPSPGPLLSCNFDDLFFNR